VADHALPRAVWLLWFRLASYPRANGPHIVYRAARPRYARGMSWTSDRDKAEWFARRWATMSAEAVAVYEARAVPVAVLADIDALEGRS
jgi:hypothetical protein